MTTLYDIVADPLSVITKKDAKKLSIVIGYRCSNKTIKSLENILNNHQSRIPHWEILRRVIRGKDNEWRFVPAQSYEYEIATVRDCIKLSKNK